MTVSFHRLDKICTDKIDFYTVRLDTDEQAEFEKFILKDLSSHAEQMSYIKSILKEIKERGAGYQYFRNERAAEAIPERYPHHLINYNDDNDFGLRLYCKRINTRLLVLFNGGIKTAQTAQECPNVSGFFNTAGAIATKIDQDNSSGEMDFDIDRCLDNYKITI